MIQPHWQWLSDGHWSKKSGSVHGLSLSMLQEQGTAVTDVANALKERLTGLTVFCDGLPMTRTDLPAFMTRQGCNLPSRSPLLYILKSTLHNQAHQRPAEPYLMQSICFDL